MNRWMIAGTRSGCGKTTVTCAVLQALAARGCDTASFKCGPDYIDPMFHSMIIGVDSHNLDRFFCTPSTIDSLLRKYSREVNVIEGVMGFYDGINGAASSHQLACETGTPVILVIDCKGMSDSLGAVMLGYLQYRQPNSIIGVIFNRLPESLIELAMSLCREMNVSYFGRLPVAPECALESRRLGLVTAAEIADLKQKTARLGELAEKHILLDRILEETRCGGSFSPQRETRSIPKGHFRVAVAKDNAFCFYYSECLDLLRDAGCEPVEFSPLSDASLPDGAAGLLLGGGYPEIYAEQLSRNTPLLSDIKKRMAQGIPTIAECGGFMYLHEELQGEDGVFYPVVGAVPGKAFRTPKLQRFGYITLTSCREGLFGSAGQTIPAHEFHYWDSTAPGSGLTARKASSGAQYPCAYYSPTLYAGFPHLYLCADPRMAFNFAEKCRQYNEEHP